MKSGNDQRLPVVGILGGLGPLAGAVFYKRLVELTPANADSDHVSVILGSDPTIPSRIAHLSGSGPSPVPALIKVARMLMDAGATLLVIPSSTTHAYYEELQQAIECPIINLPVAVAKHMSRSGYSRVGLLITEATVRAKIYEGVEGQNFVPIYGSDLARGRVQEVIRLVKVGVQLEMAKGVLEAIVTEPCWNDCDALLLGCTELAALGSVSAPVPVVSADDVLAFAVLSAIGKEA